MSDRQKMLADERLPGRQVATARDAYGDFVYPDAVPLEGADAGVVLREYWRIFNKRKWVVLSIAGAFLVVGTVVTLMMTPLYTSTLRLQIDRNVVRVIEGGNVSPIEGTDLEFLRTQYELLQSRALAERVAIALKLGDDRSFLQSADTSLLGSVTRWMGGGDLPDPNDSRRVERERAAAAIILANRRVRPVPGSRLVDLSYSDSDSARAQRIANGLAAAYSDSSLDKRFEANAYAKTFLDDQVKQLKLRLEESERQLIEFAQKEQIVSVAEKNSTAESNLQSANAALGALVSERIKSEQLWRQVESADAISMPQLLGSRVIEGLRDQRNTLMADYQEKLETFKPGYPAMVQIQNKIAEIDRQLDREVRTIKDSLRASYEGAVAQEEEMKKQIEMLRVEALDLQKRGIRYNILKREVDTNRSLYEGLLQRQKEVDVAGGVGANNIFVVDKADLAKSPSSPRIGRSLLLSLVLGLCAGLGAAFLIEKLDDSVRSVEDMERVTGLATLGIIPKVAGGVVPEVEVTNPRSAIAEAYRSLCTSLQFITASGMPRTLAVTSAGPGEGKSMTSLAIAWHFAAMGLKVLIVDADLRNPSLHKKLALPNAIGLSNYLAGACTPPDAFQSTSLPNLAFMCSGPLPPSAAELLGNARLHSLLSVGLEVFDLIIMDAPPVIGIADAALLANAVQGTIFVVGAGQMRSAQLRGALKRLDLARASLIGSALTKFDARAEGYGYGYGGDYGYGYGVNEEVKSVSNSAPKPQLSG